MFEVLSRREGVLVAYLGLIALTLIAQAVAWQVVHTRYGRRLVQGGRRRLFEAFVLGFIFGLAFNLGWQLQLLASSSLLASPGWLRWGNWAVLVIGTLIAQLSRRDVEMLVVALVGALSLPVVDQLPVPAPGLAMFVVPGFLLVRAILMVINQLRELRTGTSALSVQEAIDRLPSGLMFVRPDGTVVLINSQMRTIMAALTGRVHRHGAQFLAAVGTEATAPFEDPDAPVFKLADGSFWMLGRSEVEVAGQTLQQVVATDISLRWGLLGDLRARHRQLEASAWQLQAEIDGLVDASVADELLWARTRVHDVVGQRASALLRLVKGDAQPDRQLVVDIIGGLRAELNATAPRRTPAEELQLLRNVLSQIGVELRGPCCLPEGEGRAAAVVDIVREAVSNAIKHGSATLIDVDCRRGTDEWTLNIWDNGHSAADSIVEGGGLRGMRYRLAELGGELEVVAAPRFTLTATIPWGTP